ncbi:MAG: DUF5591 domain-containing protein [Candidatus Helarchaeota archaeon]
MLKYKTYNEVSKKIGLEVDINPSLCFYSPTDVTEALNNNCNIKKWLKFISNHYIPNSRDILLIYPCSTVKPYTESRSYRKLYKTLEKFGNHRKSIHLMTISEPFGLVPEEFYGVKSDWHDWENDWYDCPGLFEWWCRKYKFPYDQSKAEEAMEILSSYIADFFKKVDKLSIYRKKIAVVRTFSSRLEQKRDHTHRRMLERAVEKSGTDIEILPTREKVNEIVTERGSFAWDMWGVAHPMIQDMLKKKLLNYLGNNNE